MEYSIDLTRLLEIYNPDGNMDLCEDCYEEYYGMKKNFYKNMDNMFDEMVLKFLKNDVKNE